MLRPELLLILLICIGHGVCDEATITVSLPDDGGFRNHSFVYLSISGITSIDSVSSTKQPSDFDVDKSGAQHRIVFRASLPNAAYQLDVTVATGTHRLHLNVQRLEISSIDSAVFLTGPSVSVASALTRLRDSIRIISISSNSSSTEAAVQVLRPGTANVFMPLWEAANWMKNATASSGLQLMPDRCPASSTQLCRCRLVFTAGHPSVTDATVRLGSNDNFIGFNLNWVAQTVDEVHRETCGPATCLNGGRCDTNFTGAGFRCICPTSSNTPWGPRCEQPTRSYTHTAGDPLSFTRHWIGHLPHSQDAFELSFEIFGSSNEGDAETLALKNQNDLSNSLLSVSIVFRKAALIVLGSMLNGRNITFNIDQLNGGGWFIVHILLQGNKVRAVVCPRSLPAITGGPSNQPLECHSEQQDTVSATVVSRDFGNLWLEIGKALQGCVQSVAVNGYTLDLIAAEIVNVARVGTACGLQDAPCGRTATDPIYSCGAESVCYGVWKGNPNAAKDCSCRCLGSRRKVVESVTNSGLCRTRDEQVSTNACNRDPLIVNTNSSAESSWGLSNSSLLILPLRTTVTLEMELRTRLDSADSALRGVVDRQSASQIQMEIRVSNGTLRLCIDSTSCLQFPPIRVDDGEWHSMSAAIKQNLVRLTVDGVSSMHERATIGDFVSMALSSRIASSSLRNIRVTGIYMSTTSNSTDNSVDLSGLTVVPRFAGDVIVGPGSVDRAPVCSSDTCPANELCVRQWGRTVCECRAGQERGSDGACAAVNPCSKFRIRCPSGGDCQTAEGSPGFLCVCPIGVTSRLCQTRDPGTPEASIAGLDWWIWLIIAIAIVLTLAALLILLLLGRRRCLKAVDESLEIEKVHEGMGADSENEGVPPEDYQGTLSLHFPPQKESNGSLPNFQPVSTVPPPGTITGQPAVPVGAAAPEDPKDEGAGGDETLNYGYEDTRDDDAADLDQVSLVSADTDYSFDLKPTLDSWGPKFQPLSDILT